jgi:hypothetical protein
MNNRYMPQYVFNLCSVTAAKACSSDEASLYDIAKTLSDNYKSSYADNDLMEDIIMAASNIIKFINSEFPDSSTYANLFQLQYTIANFEPNGKTRKKRFFGGTFFNNEKTQILNKVEQCIANIVTYHILIIQGALPIAPKNWHI